MEVTSPSLRNRSRNEGHQFCEWFGKNKFSLVQYRISCCPPLCRRSRYVSVISIIKSIVFITVNHITSTVNELRVYLILSFLEVLCNCLIKLLYALFIYDAAKVTSHKIARDLSWMLNVMKHDCSDCSKREFTLLNMFMINFRNRK